MRQELWRAGGLLLLLLLAACSGGSPAAGTAVPSALPSTAAPVAGAEVATLPLTYRINGGIAGLNDLLEVHADGSVRLTGRSGKAETSSLPPDQLAHVTDLVGRLQRASLQDRYDLGGVADDIYHTLTFPQPGGTRSVTVAEVGGRQAAPADLLSLTALLDAIVAQTRGAPTAAP